MTNRSSLVCSGGEFQNVSARPQRPLRLAFTVIRQQHLHIIFLIIAIRQERGQRGVAKKLWGSPAEQTREEMLVIKVE